jgi:hypothetical protein
MFQERLTDLLLGLIFPPTSVGAVKQSVIDVLTELEALRAMEKGLTEDEYVGWRTSVLDEIASNRHPEPVFLFVCGFYALVFTGLLVYGVLSGNIRWAWVAGIVLAGIAVLTIGLARGLAAKRRLTVAERLELVAELARRGLVTVDEAAELGQRISRLAPGAG